MAQNPLGINQGTNSFLNFDLAGTVNTQVVGVGYGTINTIGTLPNVTLSNPTGTVVNLITGTVNLGTFVMPSGTVTQLPNIPGGSIVMTNGTLASLPNLPQGSIQVTAGTVTATVGTIPGVGSVSSLGSLGVLNAGTVNVGTFQQNSVPTIAQQTYGTLGTTGVSLVGTLVGGTGSGAGTEIFVTSVSLTIPSTGGSQDVSIGWGTAAGTFHSGTASIVRGNFPAGGGIQKIFNPAINSGTNAQLGYFQAGAGTVDINVSFFITTSTL